MSFRPIAPEIKTRLRDAIAARLPAGVPCSRNYPAGGVQWRHVWIHGDYEAAMSSYTSGGGSRQEDGRVFVRVIVKTDATAEEKALELAGAVEDAIADDPTLGGLVDFASITASAGNEAVPSEHEREYGITLTVTYSGAASRVAG